MGRISYPFDIADKNSIRIKLYNLRHLNVLPIFSYWLSYCDEFCLFDPPGVLREFDAVSLLLLSEETMPSVR
jgi:hypothetical protein